MITRPTQPTDAAEPKKHWALNYEIPISMVVAIVLQTFAIGVYVATLDSRVSTLERLEAEQKKTVENRIKIEDDRWALSSAEVNRLTKVETSLQFISEGIRRIEQKLDRKEP